MKAVSTSGLTEAVCEWLDKGWKPHGSVGISSVLTDDGQIRTTLVQALTKDAE
ncbi:DUF1737 domain-containing protein [Sulfitobacter sp. 20_GPM-1509m]|uniref:DUF1737 domain-containing protein n=1 Tax=Sulfitobacter sp. 20_GPM-1509m TaxID=1380367 RepID=UPI0034A0CD03